ncbi:hypothetical protein [Pseudomonas putida]|uniref:hypothetical protein n=1 Tax=Pseudomonas putida TaxID=303 RepID=UPI0013A6CD74|nr:hypothetical protein [Pseudomonas putida]
MIRAFLKVSIFSAACLGISACSTVEGLQPSDSSVIVEVRNTSYNEVWKSSVNAMSSGLAIVEINKSAGVIKSEAPAGMATWGEVIGLFVTPVSPSAESYSIRIVSKKRATYQITGQDWAPSIAARIRADLDAE